MVVSPSAGARQRMGPMSPMGLMGPMGPMGPMAQKQGNQGNGQLSVEVVHIVHNRPCCPSAVCPENKAWELWERKYSRIMKKVVEWVSKWGQGCPSDRVCPSEGCPSEGVQVRVGGVQHCRQPQMNSFEHPISNTQFPTGEGLELTWTLDIPCSLLDIRFKNHWLDSYSVSKWG